MKQIHILSIFLLSAFFSYGQGIGIVPLKYNESAKAQYDAWKARPKQMNKTLIPLKLPFRDDFSYIDKYLIDTGTYHGVYPFDSFWMDHYAFINATMSDSAPSIGVATLDGLNEQGLAYNTNAGAASSEPADTLTCRPIDLSVLTKGDSSVYLSFLYQAQGLGVAPKPEDSLTVEFKYLITDTSGNPAYIWKTVWSRPGPDVKNKSRAFQVAMIRVKDTSFYNNFQFRFVNYANLDGNLNHWNIDYVYLDNKRNTKDTVTKDVALSNLPNSILTSYYSLPAKQFFGGDLKGKLRQFMHGIVRNNNDTVTGNANFRFDCTYLNSSKIFVQDITSASNSQSIEKFSSYDFRDSFQAFANVGILNTQSDSIVFRTKYTITPPLPQFDLIAANNTSYRTQTFSNYFAYDDGSAEAGFGLINVQTGSVAVEYPLQVPDSLRGVLIHFNQSETNVSGYTFSLMVWSDLDLGKSPGNTHATVIKKVENQVPKYISWPNGYAYFQFDQPVYVSGSRFYVGWTQNTNYVLNIGFDRNYDEISGGVANPHIYYNVDGSWAFNTDIHGALMIRPVMGSKTFTGIDDKTNGIAAIKIYPNPSAGKFNLTLPGNESSEVSLYELNGRLLQAPLKIAGQAVLDYSSYAPGIYLLKIRNEKETGWRKLVIR